MKKQYTKKQIQESIKYWQKQLKMMNESKTIIEDIQIINNLLDMVDETNMSEADIADDPSVEKLNLTGIGYIAYCLITKIAKQITGSFVGAHNIAWITGKQLDNSLNRFKALKRIEVDAFNNQRHKLRQFIDSYNKNELYLVVSKPNDYKHIPSTQDNAETTSPSGNPMMSIQKFARLLANGIAKAIDLSTAGQMLDMIDVLELSIDTTTFYVVRII